MEGIAIPSLCVLGVNTVIFVVFQIVKDNSIVDVIWGLSFIYPLLVLEILNDNWTESSIIVLVLISIWGLRLSIHIGSRYTRVEDFRYQEMRNSWMKYG
mmetsp:Transcript_35234/g.34251  ORF Transcript_35234/g.34251 Transcript_35234/m.34251 type:complete len:99 (-) Transcript_35234:366-662(-)